MAPSLFGEPAADSPQGSCRALGQNRSDEILPHTCGEDIPSRTIFVGWDGIHIYARCVAVHTL